ncbi:MAG: ABC transporter permease [Anaerolineales bacterium]|nr:ABC transporter permease [Anaerolineales bacterium]
MGVINSKILRELWGFKNRTLQVVLIIGIGAAAIGMILGTRNLVIPGMQDMWQDFHPAMINLYMYSPVDDNDIAILKNVEGVSEIEGVNSSVLEWRLNPQDEWKQGGINTRTDYLNQQMNILELVSGEYPHDDVAVVELGSDSFFGIPTDGEVYIRINNRTRKLKIGGMIYNSFSQPAYFGGTAQFYVTQEEYEHLMGDNDYSQLYIRAAQYDEEAIKELGDRLQARIKKMENDSYRLVLDPNKHFFQDQLDGIFLLLGVLGALSLVLGLLLVYNTVNAIIGRQVDQIGIMKAIGANTWQIFRIYLTSVFMYGVLALLLAVPLGVIGAWTLSSWLVGSFGADFGTFDLSWGSVWVMIAITLAAPLLASFIPIISGVRITVREAISTYGLTTDTGFIEKMLARAKHISRMILLTISNALRNKRRVVILELSLVISGLIFMMVVIVYDSVVFTIKDVMFAILNADITLLFNDYERNKHIEEMTLGYPGVKAVEMWGLANANIRPKGQPATEDDESITMFGVPLPTNLYGYQMRQGRWLQPEDSYAIVLNQKLAEEIDVKIGDWITIKYENDKESDWQVVGLVFDPIFTNAGNVPREVLLRDLNQVGRGIAVWIQTIDQNPEKQTALAKELRDFYKKNGVEVSAVRGVFGFGGDATHEVASALIKQFNFLIVLLAVMAIIIGLVGSIALSGALSLSVMERRREIGVMRAIGASSWTIARLFIGEGLLLGWLSWLIALPISIPAGRGMVAILSNAFGLDISYHYTLTGAIMWFFVITILSIIASWLPARGASKISVRESLAYQ